MPECIILVGPPGSGKSTSAKEFEKLGYVRISQDDQGKQGHQSLFRDTIYSGQNVIVDRMGFNKQQRHDYLTEAKAKGYKTTIIVFHESYETCLNRCLSRVDHPTIKNETNARSALQTFFTKYERPTPDEADEINFFYPENKKELVVVFDIDGTVANVEHREHYVQFPEGQKKDWNKFFSEMDKDTPNYPVCANLLLLSKRYKIVYCSGRPDNYREQTKDWLNRFQLPGGDLYMRNRVDSRQDSIIKEILLDFEILPRYDILMWFDDRQQVVDKIRSRGVTVFQVAPGNF